MFQNCCFDRGPLWVWYFDEKCTTSSTAGFRTKVELEETKYDRIVASGGSPPESSSLLFLLGDVLHPLSHDVLVVTTTSTCIS